MWSPAIVTCRNIGSNTAIVTCIMIVNIGGAKFQLSPPEVDVKLNHRSTLEREAIRLRQLRHEFCSHVTCMTIVTSGGFCNATIQALARWPVPLRAASNGLASGGVF